MAARAGPARARRRDNILLNLCSLCRRHVPKDDVVMRLSGPRMAIGIMDVHMIDFPARALESIDHCVRVEQPHRQHVDGVNQPALAVIAVERSLPPDWRPRAILWPIRWRPARL